MAPGLVACAFLLAPTGASAQAASDPGISALLMRIERLQRDMNTLQSRVYRGTGGPVSAAPGGAPGPRPATGPTAVGAPSEPNLAAAMQVRLDEIESRMRAYTGRLEEVNHAVNKLSNKLERLTSDIGLRLKALEARAVASASTPAPASAPTPGTLPSGPPPATAAPSRPGLLGSISLKELNKQGLSQSPLARPEGAAKGTSGDKPRPATAILPKGTPKEQYRFATAFLRKSDWAGAERALSAFLVAHPKHKLAGNAQYWLGESYYARGDFNDAALAFAKGYKDFPKSAKGPDNLLKLGLSLANLKKIDSACATFARIGKDFAGAPKTITSRVAAERKKLGCR